MMDHVDFSSKFHVFQTIMELHAKIWFQDGITHKMDLMYSNQISLTVRQVNIAILKMDKHVI